jgi:hypothetical protein
LIALAADVDLAADRVLDRGVVRVQADQLVHVAAGE